MTGRHRLSVLIDGDTQRRLRHMKVCRGRSHTESVRKAVALLYVVGDAEVIVRRPGTRGAQ